MGTVTVRAASGADLAGLLELFRELAGEKSSALPAPLAEAERRLPEILGDARRELAVGLLDGRIAGTADLIIVPQLTHRGEPWAAIENVIVAGAARRHGVGSALLEHLIERAREAGCCKVQLLSGKHRTEAHRFYRRAGMSAVAEGFKLYFDE